MTSVDSQNKSKDKLKLEAALKYLIRTSFWAFCLFYDEQFFSKRPFLKIIAKALQKVTDGIITKLMISVPPRAGKSYTVSLWCAWTIGRLYEDPSLSIMRNSYGQSLAEKFSYDIRDIIQSAKYKFIFPNVELKQDHQSVKDWAVQTSLQSTYFCAGVGGGITGKGCKTAAILDDPIKNLEDALSEVVIEKTWTWYLSTHKSRLESNCPEIHIATRWSKKDPIGRLEEEQEGDWTIIKIPALNDDGSSFCEDVKTTDEYLELKGMLDDYIWNAEYMQSPIEAKGLLFPKSELNYYSGNKYKKDQVVSIFGFTDTADEGTDYLASVTAVLYGKTKEELRVYIHDVVFTQDPIEITMPIVAAKLIANNHNSHKIESNNGGKGFALKVKELIKNKSNCIVTWQATTSNKETRMLMNSGQIKKYFYFRTDYKPGSDYDKFMNNLTSYVKMGKNKNDDAPDVLTGVAEQVFPTGGLRILSNKTGN